MDVVLSWIELSALKKKAGEKNTRCTLNLEVQVQVRNMSAPNLKVRLRFTWEMPNLNWTELWPV